MPLNHFTRRDSLKVFGGSLAGIVAATNNLSSAEDKQPQNTVAATNNLSSAEDKQPQNTPIIDVHFHIAKSRLPGSLDGPLSLAPFEKGDVVGPKTLAKKIEAEAKAAGVVQALCMPRFQVSDKDPLGIQDTLAMIELIRGPKLHPVGLAHPERFDQDHMERVEEVLKEGKVKAFKAYLGYLRYEPLSPGYRLYFKLAAKYKIPVVFHCGDTYSKSAKLKYSHPLKIDEVAVDYPETKFVIAHFGNPWLLDAAQVAYKNDNVWVDLSAVVIGDAAAFAKKEKEGLLDGEVRRLKEAIAYTEDPEKFLFGSDWPLTSQVVYRDFIRRVFPEKHHAAVFGNTAKKLFGL